MREEENLGQDCVGRSRNRRVPSRTRTPPSTAWAITRARAVQPRRFASGRAADRASAIAKISVKMETRASKNAMRVFIADTADERRNDPVVRQRPVGNGIRSVIARDERAGNKSRIVQQEVATANR